MSRRQNKTAATVNPTATTPKIAASRELIAWASSGKGVEIGGVDWSKEDSPEAWQAFIDEIAKQDRKLATSARDVARELILRLSEGSIWERVLWPGHADALSARHVLVTAAGELPKGPPQALEWPAAVERVKGTVIAARELLVRADVRTDVAAADTIIQRLEEAERTARHALDAPELAIAPTPPATDTGGGWWAILVLIWAAFSSDESRP